MGQCSEVSGPLVVEKKGTGWGAGLCKIMLFDNRKEVKANDIKMHSTRFTFFGQVFLTWLNLGWQLRMISYDPLKKKPWLSFPILWQFHPLFHFYMCLQLQIWNRSIARTEAALNGCSMVHLEFGSASSHSGQQALQRHHCFKGFSNSTEVSVLSETASKERKINTLAQRQ